MNLVQKLAYEFADQMADCLTTEELTDVIIINRENNDNTCHSGDLIDSNMVMAAAFEAIGLDAPSADCELETDLWNQAWDMAKKADFYRGHLAPRVEHIVVVRHLDKHEADLINDFVDNFRDQKEGTMQYACVHTIQNESNDAEVTLTC